MDILQPLKQLPHDEIDLPPFEKGVSLLHHTEEATPESEVHDDVEVLIPNVQLMQPQDVGMTPCGEYAHGLDLV